jgi:hypothetical protein
MRRSLARGAIVGLGTLAVVAACSNSEQASQSVPSPAATETASPSSTAAAPPPVFAPTTTPPAPVEIAPAEESSPTASAAMQPRAPSPPRLSRPSNPAPTQATEPAAKPKPDHDGLHATPAPNLGVKKVAVLANNHYTCSSTEKRDNVAAFPEPRGARIAIVGQGPCPGEVHDWSAQVTQQRVEVHGTHGSASKCRCVGSGELVLRGLEPGTYEIAVNGGFDRPIATRITILQ